MSDEWYYGENGNTVGPLSFEQITERVKRNIHHRNLVWTEGMPDWADAKTVPSLAGLFRTIPPPLPSTFRNTAQLKLAPRIDLGSYAPERRTSSILPQASARAADQRDAADIHPWRRYFARIFDLAIFCFAAGVTVGVLFPQLYKATKSAGQYDHLLGVVYLAAYIPIEAFLLYAFGTTLGKALYGITVRGEMTFFRAMRRSAMIWWRGLGMGLPIVTLFTLFNAYKKLKENGRTTWDADLSYNIQHAPLSAIRWIAVLVCWVAVAFIFIVVMGLVKGK